ncbi:MAG: hypothetical protein V1810_04735 [Candidatus Beckwithbacteria bacterium]
MRIVEGQPPNCRGYALHQLGLLDKEAFIDESPLDQYPLIEASKEEATAIGVLAFDSQGVLGLRHLMVIDTENKNYVWHRPSTGQDPVREGLWTALNLYDEGISRMDSLVYLKPING